MMQRAAKPLIMLKVDKEALVTAGIGTMPGPRKFARRVKRCRSRR